VHHEEELPQRIVGGEALALRAAHRLHDEEVRAADRLRVAAVDLAVGERLQTRVGQFDLELLSDLPPSSRLARPAVTIRRFS